MAIVGVAASILSVIGVVAATPPAHAAGGDFLARICITIQPNPMFCLQI